MALRRTILLLVFTFYLSMFCALKGSANDYSRYHLSIIKIEEQLFVSGKIDDGLKSYLRLFQEYDFVFLQDCLTAIQMSLYAGDEAAFLAFIDKATKNGLMPRHLKRIAYIKDNALYKKNTDTIETIYNRNRFSYLNRVDTAVLRSVYSICAFDQIDKIKRPGESRDKYEVRYKADLVRSISRLRKIIDIKGWIGDKLIGVDQNDIMKELRVNGLDFHEYYTKYKEEAVRNTQSQFLLNEISFSSTPVIPLILHYGMFQGDYNRKKNFIYSDSFFLKQIRSGNIHPKEVAFFYDQSYSEVRGSKPDTKKGEKYFGVGLRIADTQADSLIIPDEDINRFRKELFIAPVQSDRAKVTFILKNGMYIGWGFHSMRS